MWGTECGHGTELKELVTKRFIFGELCVPAVRTLSKRYISYNTFNCFSSEFVKKKNSMKVNSSSHLESVDLGTGAQVHLQFSAPCCPPTELQLTWRRDNVGYLSELQRHLARCTHSPSRNPSWPLIFLQQNPRHTRSLRRSRDCLKGEGAGHCLHPGTPWKTKAGQGNAWVNLDG